MPSQAAAIGERLRKELATAAKAVALEIDKELRRNTPVDTGHARRNWVPSVGAAFEGEANGDGEHAAGVASVLGYTLDAGPIWVSNNTPYINALNYGHSKQKPAGFIERAVDIAVARIQERYVSKGIDISDMRSAVQSQIGGAGAENLASAYSPFGGDE